MNIGKSIKKALFPALKIAYVGIATEGSKAHLLTRILQNRKVTKEEKREFELPGGHPTGQMLEYLNRIEKSHTYAYTATILSSINQGAIPSCDRSFFEKVGVDTQNIVTVSKEDAWSIYASELDIQEIQNRYEPIDGIDFIFPSEAMVDFLRQQPKLSKPHKGEAVLYLLYEKNSASLVIYLGEIITYSSHFVFDEEEEGLIEDESDDVSDLLDDGLDESDIQEEIVELDTIGDQDDLGGIEDLDDFISGDDSLSFDSFDDMGDTALGESDMTGGTSGPDDSFFEEEPESNLKRDMLLFNFIKNSVHDFYHNKHLESGFITHAVIYDTHGSGRGLGRFLQEELYIETATFDVNLSGAICDMAIAEAGE